MTSSDFAGAFGNSSVFDDGTPSIIATPTQQTSIQKADTNWLDNLVKVVGVGVSAFATVEAAKAAGKQQNNANTATEAQKVAAPIIGTPSAGSGIPSAVWWVGGGLIALVLGAILLRPRR